MYYIVIIIIVYLNCILYGLSVHIILVIVYVIVVYDIIIVSILVINDISVPIDNTRWKCPII